jgi:uncharacterized protein
MINHPYILVDTGIMVALYDASDSYHQKVGQFLETCK